MNTKKPIRPFKENAMDLSLIEELKKENTPLPTAISNYYMAPIKAMLKREIDDEKLVNRIIMNVFFVRLKNRCKDITGTMDLQKIIFKETIDCCSAHFQSRPLQKITNQLNALQSVFFQIEYLPENHRSVLKKRLQTKEAEEPKMGLPKTSTSIAEARDALLYKLAAEEKIRAMAIFITLFVPSLLKKD